jgi:hypothetical protein
MSRGFGRKSPRDHPRRKLNVVDPQAYFTDLLTKLVNLWPAARIDGLAQPQINRLERLKAFR